MDKREISNWVRQGRHRAKKYNLEGDIKISDVEEIIERQEGKCSYCGAPFEYLDCIFPLKSQAPFVPSNTTLVCSCCREKKGSNDIQTMLREGKLSNQQYVGFIRSIIDQNDPRMLLYIKSISGIVDDEE